MRRDAWSGGSYQFAQVYWVYISDSTYDKNDGNIWIYSSGSYYGTTFTAMVLPVFTLNDNACIMGGNGTKDDPYILGSKEKI